MARKPKKSEVAETNKQVADEAPEEPRVDEAPVEEQSAVEVVEDVSQMQRSLCGGALNAARQAQDLTVQDVAKQLRLGVKQVEALEADNFSVLPEPTIVKGFIRNYAKLLKIPSESLIAAYMDLKPETEQHALAINPSINMKITESRKTDKSRYFIFALLLLFGAGLWFFYQNYVQKPSPVNLSPEVVEVLPELALPRSERVENNESTQLEMPNAEAVDIASAETIDTNRVPLDKKLTKKPEENAENSQDNTIESSDAVAEPMAEPAAETESTERPAPIAGKTRLEINATQETWVSIVNASGKEVYNKILYAGNHEVIDLWHPSQIVFGNAHGATLTVDGKPIDLAPYTRINVARVRLNR
jgi:cytoskeleton protein RodZ